MSGRGVDRVERSRRVFRVAVKFGVIALGGARANERRAKRAVLEGGVGWGHVDDGGVKSSVMGGGKRCRLCVR